MALPAEEVGLSQTPEFDKFMADSVRIKADPYAVGCIPPGSMVKWTVPDAVPYWHGQQPYVVMKDLSKVDEAYWNSLAGQKGLYAHVTEPCTITLLPPPDHRYDRILEEFGAKTVYPAERNEPEPLVWTPPPGAFPEPEVETVLEFPKGDEWVREIGRWKCSVVVKIKGSLRSITKDSYPNWSYAREDRMWLQVEPREDVNLPTYQRWSTTKDTGRELNQIFLDWLTEIEANPECCVKHKLIGKYDDTECVGQRSEKPPVGLIPEEQATWFSIGDLTKAYNSAMFGQAITDNIFLTSPITSRLSKGSTPSKFSGGNKIRGLFK